MNYIEYRQRLSELSAAYRQACGELRKAYTGQDRVLARTEREIAATRTRRATVYARKFLRIWLKPMAQFPLEYRAADLAAHEIDGVFRACQLAPEFTADNVGGLVRVTRSVT